MGERDTGDIRVASIEVAELLVKEGVTAIQPDRAHRDIFHPIHTAEPIAKTAQMTAQKRKARTRPPKSPPHGSDLLPCSDAAGSVATATAGVGPGLGSVREMNLWLTVRSWSDR